MTFLDDLIRKAMAKDYEFMDQILQQFMPPGATPEECEEYIKANGMELRTWQDNDDIGVMKKGVLLGTFIRPKHRLVSGLMFIPAKKGKGNGN